MPALLNKLGAARLIAAASLVPSAVLLAGCQELAQAATEIFFGPAAQRELSDADLFQHLRKDRTAAPRAEAAQALAAIDAEAAGEGPAPDDAGAERMFRRVAASRLAMDDHRYQRTRFEEFAAAGECGFGVDLDAMRDEFLIPQADKIPVRDQGLRGTCAAFSGVAAIEYAALNERTGNPALPTLDLSEQRFYFASKQECQGPTGCECPGCAEGSWYGYGFDTSAAAAEPDVPLEADCPYNRMPGNNDTQYPQLGSCGRGAVKVEQVASWCGVRELVELLHDGYAVPYAGELSSNWEVNEGLITKADFDSMGASVHAAGHAYLIVGYRKLPQMPEEGGACFVVKNSWGLGWGVGGFACMTLAWMEALDLDGMVAGPLPAVRAVALRADLAAADALPPGDDEAEDALPPDVPDYEPIPDPEPEPPPDGGEDGGDGGGDEEGDGGGDEEGDGGGEDGADDILPPDPPPPPPAPDPEPPPPAPELVDLKLRGPGEAFYRVKGEVAADHVRFVGVLRGDGEGVTTELTLARRGDLLMYERDDVGRIDEAAGEMSVCTAQWESLCSLRYRESDGALYVQFRDDDLRNVTAEEVNADVGGWLNVLGGGLSVFVPHDPTSIEFVRNPKVFIKLPGNTDPTRLSLRPDLDAPGLFRIRVQGIEVGAIDLLSPLDSELCSGGYGQTCLVLGTQRAFVIPRNRRGAR